ncbi:MAG: hypothetical protein Alpg2KO_04280 [Alphaproteobacteria bacterium]
MSQVNILLVDDSLTEKKMFELYVHRIAHRDIKLHHAASMEQATRIISEDSHQIDLIFLDSHIPPWADYRQTIPMIRQAGFEGPVIILSGYTTRPIFEEYRQYGAQLCTDKLYMAKRLEGLIDRALQMDVAPQRPLPGQSASFG